MSPHLTNLNRFTVDHKVEVQTEYLNDFFSYVDNKNIIEEQNFLEIFSEKITQILTSNLPVEEREKLARLLLQGKIMPSASDKNEENFKDLRDSNDLE
jgi:hypothetical protein